MKGYNTGSIIGFYIGGLNIITYTSLGVPLCTLDRVEWSFEDPCLTLDLSQRSPTALAHNGAKEAVGGAGALEASTKERWVREQ